MSSNSKRFGPDGRPTAAKAGATVLPWPATRSSVAEPAEPEASDAPAAARADGASSGIEERYASALRRYLRKPDESLLAEAYVAGRSALVQGAGLLDLIALHRAALESITEERFDERRRRAAREFFVEAVAPFEMALRGYRDATGGLRQLNERLETEIRRIAHTLHDDIQHLLAGVATGVEELSRDPMSRDRVDAVLARVDEISERVRTLARDLRPPLLDDLGLKPALESLARGVARRSGLAIEVDGALAGRLESELGLALYRVTQEALNNVVQHARARRVRVDLREEDAVVRLTIRDDGAGFDVESALDPDRRGLGILGMRERVGIVGGKLEIDSGPGRGSELRFVVPRGDLR